MGGVQYGPPLRGYDELTITPRGHVPNETPGFSRLDRVGASYFGLYASLGLNLGGGIEFALVAGVIFLELKYILGNADQLVAAFGYRHRLR